MKNLSSIGEFAFIEKIKSSCNGIPADIMGIGDDCAIMPYDDKEDLLVSCDLLIENIHFLRNKISPNDIGWKSAAVNLSDIAAMGGTPWATFLSIALPADLSLLWAEEFIGGYMACLNQYGVLLLGGDTTSSKGDISINVTVMGRVAKGKAKLRSMAKNGDIVCATGTLGDSGAGLKMLLDNRLVAKIDSDMAYLMSRHCRPTPRIEESLLISNMDFVHAMMDVSDGVASDIRHIAEASGVGVTIDLDALPISIPLANFCAENNLDERLMAVSSGEDYELLFTLDPSHLAEIPFKYSVIGHITDGSGVHFFADGKEVNREISGFNHFKTGSDEKL